MLFLFSCSSKKVENNIENKQQPSKSKDKADLFDENKHFYTVDPKVEDIEAEMAMLKDRVLQYEAQVTTPNFNTEILKLIKNPNIKHEVELSNGTILQGVIVYENADEMIIETQIGQLQINKNEIVRAEDVLPPRANLEFIGEPIEEIYDEYRAYQGNLKNNGAKRADFVRVIYYMFAEDTELIASDSSFVSGSKKIFKSGIISDSSIESGEYGTFYVKVNIPEDREVKYFTKDIQFDYFE